MVPKRQIFIVSSAVLLLFALVLAVPALGQGGGAVGNLYGKVVDEQGAPLPGSEVTLSGCGAPNRTVSNTSGDFRFLNLTPCTYTLHVALQGFTTVDRPGVVVGLGTASNLTVSMKLGAVATAVTVTSEAPLLDTRKVDTGAIVNQQELNSIPTGRDPWVILQSVPGVMLDRVNVAGSESGQQSTFMSRGATGGTFVVDGVNQTDATAAGASAGYFDFGSFQEIQVNTGGSDITFQGTGAHLNMITKRGTNEVHGSARFNVVDEKFEATNSGTGTAGARLINSIQDYGVEGGGPLWTDHLWLWGSYGRNQINVKTGTSTTPNSKTTLENTNGKLNAQFIPENSLTIWAERKDKIVFGRGSGAGRDASTTEDQTTPQNSFKIEDSHVFSPNLFVSAKLAAISKGDFTLDPESGPAAQPFQDANGDWHGGYYFLDSNRTNRSYSADSNIFLSTGNVGHELKVGFGYNKAKAYSNQGYTGTFINGQADHTFGTLALCGSGPCAAITRAFLYESETKYYNAFLQDTVTFDRLTINAGVRWDKQYGQNNPTTAPGSAAFPTVLPALVYTGQDKQFTWKDWSPRVGITYALGPERKTLLKASYARFVEGLGTATVTRTNPAGSIAYAYYPWDDANGDNIVQVSEVNLAGGPLPNSGGYNPADPGNPGIPNNKMDPDLKSPKTDEFIVGVEHQLLPDLAIGLSYTHRKYKDLLMYRAYDPGTGRVLTDADYQLSNTLTGNLPDGTPYSMPVYDVKPSVLATLTNGSYPAGLYETNNPDYSQKYNGIDFTVTKRLSNHWSARANFSYNTFKQSGCQGGGGLGPNEPNNGTVSSASYGYRGGTCQDGDYVSVQSAGSGNHILTYLNAKYVYNLNVLYQLPLGFDIAGALFGRQGYPINYWRRTVGVDDGVSRDIAVVGVDSQRLASLYEFDLRLAKNVQVTQGVSLAIAADCFNVTNNEVTLQLRNRLDRPDTATIREVQNPRTWRFSARLSF